MKKSLFILLILIFLTTFAFAADTSGANAPEVYQGLYPIKYSASGDVLFTNASDSDWYNYSEGRWANAVTLDKLGRMNPSAATEANITGYYVWIPRYAYLIRTGYNSAETGRIDIRFLSGTTNTDKEGKTYYSLEELNNSDSNGKITYIGDRQMEYLVHSAFNFEEKLTGIWVGKYEASKGIAREIEIVNTIPNGVLWKSIDISSSFKETREMVSTSENYDKYNLYGLGEDVNTHLIKNIEYGAVVYLADSIYGADNYYKVNGIDSGKEYIAGYLEGTEKLGILGLVGDKYKDIYSKNESGNIIDIKGSACLETSDGVNAWNNETIVNIDETNGVIVKDGAYGMIASAGKDTDVGFRVVITKGISKNKLKDVYVAGESYWFIMENGDIWVMGENSSGQLGVGDFDYKYLPVKLEKDKDGDKLPVMKKIKSNGTSTYFLSQNGEIYVCGANGYGRLGVGGTDSQPTIMKIPALEDIVIKDITYDSFYGNTYYITNNGEVYVSGWNYNGELGVGNTEHQYTATRITALDGVVIENVIVLGSSIYYISENGDIYVSGKNNYGKLGIGTTTNQTTVTKLTALEGVKIKNIQIHSDSIYYISENGDVYVSGRNNYGQLGIGSTTDQTTAIKLPALEGIIIKNIVAEQNSIYYISENGEVYVSGKNDYGQLGIGTTANQTTAVKINELEGNVITEIISGGEYVFYLTQEGKVYVSGWNYYGNLGIEEGAGSMWEYVSLAAKITSLDDLLIEKIVTNGGCTFFITDKGEVYCCGYNYAGQLGIGNTRNIYEPIKIPALNDVIIKDIILGGTQSWTSVYYITNNGEVYVSGCNSAGELKVEGGDKIKTAIKSESLNLIEMEIMNNGYYMSENKEVYTNEGNIEIFDIKNVDDKMDIVISDNTTFYIDINGQVYVSGATTYGLVEKIEALEGKVIKDVAGAKYYLTDNGEVYSYSISNSETTATKLTELNGEVIKEIIYNGGSVYFLTEDGEVYVTGTNNNGQLGIGNSTNQTKIRKIETLEGVKIKNIISNDYASTYYLSEDGEVYVSGRNDYGQLGIGTTTKQTTVVKVEALNDLKIKKIIPSLGTECQNVYYLTETGEVYACGRNYHGELGLGNATRQTTATKIPALDGIAIKDIVSWGWYGASTYYIAENGDVYVSGYNNYGQLGVGNTTEQKTARQITALDGIAIKQIRTNRLGQSTFYLSEAGEVYASGDNSSGELGLGSTSSTQRTAKKLSGLSGVRIKDIVTKYFLDENGEVYFASGSGTLRPQKIDSLKGVVIKEILSKTYYDVHFLGENGDVYGAGKNESLQLGVAYKSSVSMPKHIKERDYSYSTLGDIISIYGNATSTIFEQSNGDIYVIGDNTNNKLGTTGTIDIATKIKLKNIKDAGVGSDFSVFLKDDGSVVGYGNSTKNGNGLTNISQIAVGSNHAVFLNKNGSIINKGSTTSAYVSGVSRIYKIVAGDNHTVVLMKDGTTKSFGQADSGLTNVIDIFAGKDMTVYITNDNKTYLMENDTLTELVIDKVVYAELNGQQPYFLTYNRDLLDKEGHIVELLDTELQWVKEVKGDVVLNEKMKVYDLGKV